MGPARSDDLVKGENSAGKPHREVLIKPSLQLPASIAFLLAQNSFFDLRQRQDANVLRGLWSALDPSHNARVGQPFAVVLGDDVGVKQVPSHSSSTERG